MKKLIFTSLIAFVISPVYAGHYASNLNEEHLLISVTNETPHNCELDDANAIKGYDMSLLRPNIPSAGTATFVVSHPLSSAHYFIAYRCGNEQDGYKRVAFISKRNVGFFWAGYTRGEFLEDQSTPGITSIITDKGRGSVKIWLNGYIDWSIRYQ